MRWADDLQIEVIAQMHMEGRYVLNIGVSNLKSIGMNTKPYSHPKLWQPRRHLYLYNDSPRSQLFHSRIYKTVFPDHINS